MILGVLKEDSTERRVAVTPDTISAIQKLGIEKIIVEQGAGDSASYSDQDYKDKGAETASRSDVLKNANLLACIKGISHDEIKSLAEGVSGSLGGKTGIAPRIFLKKLVLDLLDRIEMHEDFDPRKDYRLTIRETELTPEERNASPAGSVEDVSLTL